MKHLKDRMQNYNDDVELCCDNIKNRRDLSSDFYNISFKPLHILLSVKRLMEQMETQKDYTNEIFALLLKNILSMLRAIKTIF